MLFDVMSHGRDEQLFEDVTLSDTVGFFNTYNPLVLETGARGDRRRTAVDLLTEQIEPQRQKGFTFDLLRCFAEDPQHREVLNALPRSQVLFNFYGRRSRSSFEPRDSALRLAAEPCGETHDPKGRRYYPVAITAEILKDRLRLNFVYSRNLHTKASIEILAQNFRDYFVELAGRARVES